jgi:hypothetical protein
MAGVLSDRDHGDVQPVGENRKNLRERLHGKACSNNPPESSRRRQLFIKSAKFRRSGVGIVVALSRLVVTTTEFSPSVDFMGAPSFGHPYSNNQGVISRE